MGQLHLLELLFQVRLVAFDICETFVFLVLTLGLAIHTVRLIINFFRGGGGPRDE
jgi:hypothetical protein